MKNTNQKSEIKKADIKRQKILRAASKVFARQSYNAASMRMIGKEGGFDHAIIRYYFPTKANLFETIVSNLAMELNDETLLWFKDVGRMSPSKGLTSFIERFLDYNERNPEALKIIVQNIAQSDPLDSIPGYMKIPEVLTSIRKTFEENVLLTASQKEIIMFIDSFNALVITYLGANSCQAQILGMDPESEEYKNWVKEALLYVFLPLLKKLIFGDNSSL